MNDCRATLHLLSLTLPISGQPILEDRLEARGYRWSNGVDGRPKAWFRDVDDADLAAAEQFLTDELCGGRPRHDQPGSRLLQSLQRAGAASCHVVVSWAAAGRSFA